MFAVVEITGQQFEVRPQDVVKVPLLNGEPGDVVTFDKVLAGGEDSSANIGTPYIDGKVTAKILEHGKDSKILVFHKKRRKGYRKLNGHRQHFSKIEITGIDL